MVDVLRLLVVIDHLGNERGLARATVSNYFSGAKYHYLLAHSLDNTPPPAAWGGPGVHHRLVTMALKAIPERKRPVRMILSAAWIEDGFRNCWTTTEYVSIAFLYGWVLRGGEGCDFLQGHIITWSMIAFYVWKNEQLHEMPMTDLRTTPCDQMDLHQDSRKYQHGPRLMPGRVNTCHLADPARGALDWCHLCMPTIMQGWAILNNIDHMSQAERERRPVLAQPGREDVLSVEAVSQALKANARRRGEPETSVSSHCLRATGITMLANSAVADNPTMFLRAVGHKSMQSSEPYVRPSPFMAQAVTEALQATPFHHSVTSSTTTPPTTPLSPVSSTFSGA